MNLWPEQGVPLALPVRLLVEQLVAGPKTGTNTGKASGTLARLPNLYKPRSIDSQPIRELSVMFAERTTTNNIHGTGTKRRKPVPRVAVLWLCLSMWE